MERLELEYYYGKEAEQFTFYRLPKALITDPRFKDISNNAKLLYGLMLDRMSLAGIVSVVIFMAMENKVEEAQLKTKVVAMKESVAPNTLIKGDELNKYFEEMSVELTAVLESAYRSVKDLPKDGLYVENTMGK